MGSGDKFNYCPCFSLRVFNNCSKLISSLIKANFPARLSFRVMSKIDSRTILDTGGADQLVGMGDMLLSAGSDIIRLQSPFVDTPEIEKVCDYIGAQRGYDSAYELLSAYR